MTPAGSTGAISTLDLLSSAACFSTVIPEAILIGNPDS
jgi:hypothetical protein